MRLKSKIATGLVLVGLLTAAALPSASQAVIRPNVAVGQVCEVYNGNWYVFAIPNSGPMYTAYSGEGFRVEGWTPGPGGGIGEYYGHTNHHANGYINHYALRPGSCYST
jgi:hypothetical protein